MKIQYINIDVHNSEPGKKNAGFSMPSETPFGNFHVKLKKIISRSVRTNELIQDVFTLHYEIKKMPYCEVDHFIKYFMLIEEIIYHLRKCSDELISIFDILSYYIEYGKYRDKIKNDCIGSILKNKNCFAKEPFKEHHNILELMNEVSNAYKHSFIHSELNQFDFAEPVVYALGLDYNKLTNEMKYFKVSLNKLLLDFNLFYIDISNWIKKFPNSS